MDQGTPDSANPVAAAGASADGGGTTRLGGGIVLALAGLALAFFGLRTGNDALVLYVDRTPGAHDAITHIGVFVLYLFAAAQVGAGAGLCAAGLRLAHEGWRRSAYPTEPWLWRSDWAAGVIKHSRSRLVPVAWLAAVGWNLPLWLTLAPRAPLRDWLAREAYWGVGAFGALVLVGALLALAAVIATVRWWRFRASVFEMTSVPGRIGGDLRGTVRARVRLGGDAQFRVRLVCEQSPGLGGSRIALWQPEYTIDAGSAAISSLYSTIPVRFDIPRACRPSEARLRNPLVWRLMVVAGRPGMGYRAEFQVPVFHGANGNTAASAPDDADLRDVAGEDSAED